MTREEAKDFIPLLTAWANGAALQTRDNERSTNWHDFSPTSNASFRKSLECYRIKPTAKYRAWKPEEVVPLIGKALIRVKGGGAGAGLIVAVAHNSEIRFGAYTRDRSWAVESSETAFRDYDHSTDGGATWNPCGILEDAQ